MTMYLSYIEEIRENLNYVPTWLPTLVLEPGDVCDMSSGELRRVGNLNDFQIMAELGSTGVESEVQYSSAGSVNIQVKAKGEPPPVGSLLKIEDVGITCEFARAGSVVLQLTGCSSRTVRNVLKIGQQVLERHQAGGWPDGYVVVTEVLSAGASTIVISSEANATIDFEATGSAGFGPVSLAKLNAGLKVKAQRKIGAQFVSAPGLTPLIQTAGVKKRFLRADQFKGRDSSATFEFGNVDYSDFTS